MISAPVLIGSGYFTCEIYVDIASAPYWPHDSAFFFAAVRRQLRDVGKGKRIPALLLRSLLSLLSCSELVLPSCAARQPLSLGIISIQPLRRQACPRCIGQQLSLPSPRSPRPCLRVVVAAAPPCCGSDAPRSSSTGSTPREPRPAPSSHVHQIVGGNAFNASMTTGDVSATATCTTCQFSEDFSNYWTANLYFKAKNGTYKRVPQGGAA